MNVPPVQDQSEERRDKVTKAALHRTRLRRSSVVLDSWGMTRHQVGRISALLLTGALHLLPMDRREQGTYTKPEAGGANRQGRQRSSMSTWCKRCL